MGDMPADHDRSIDVAIDAAGHQLRRHYADEIAALRRRASRRRRTVRAFVGTGAAMMAALGLMLATAWREVAAPATAPASVMVADGIRIDLDAGAAVELPRLPWRHQARIVRGDVVFDIRHDDNRPFVVHAGDTRLTDLGTRFLVRHSPMGTDIAVYDGKVRVETATNLSAEIQAGHAIAVRSGALAPCPLPAEAMATAWRQGMLVFRDTPLAEVAARLSRYRTVPLTVETAGLAALPVNGVFHIDDPGGALLTLQRALPLRVRYDHDRTVLTPASPRSTAPAPR